ncbi:hypothetical protein, partial [Acidipropionibacterium jensenii]|uniref:hypothetical protein n=1 Tax=Acidipropionibacterium jensenii TaxID=1749 RepID=UPI001FDFF265
MALIGLNHGEGGVGDEGVVPVRVEEFPLIRMSCRVQPFDASYDEPAGDLVLLGMGRECGERDFCDLSVTDPLTGVFFEDGVGVVDPHPGIFADRADGSG